MYSCWFIPFKSTRFYSGGERISVLQQDLVYKRESEVSKTRAYFLTVLGHAVSQQSVVPFAQLLCALRVKISLMLTEKATWLPKSHPCRESRYSQRGNRKKPHFHRYESVA